MKCHFHNVVAASLVSIALPLVAQEKDFGPEFGTLKTQYDARVRTDVQQAFDAGVVDLNAKYTASLDRALESAQRAGKLDDAVALKAEKEALAVGKAVPDKDDDKIPVALKQLRVVYRTSMTRLEAERISKLRPLQATFGKSLDSVISRLTTDGKLNEAMEVRKYRDGLAEQVPTASALHVVTGKQLTAQEWEFRVISEGVKGVWKFNADKSVTGFPRATWSIKDKILHVDGGRLWCDFALDVRPSAGPLVLEEVDSSRGKRTATLTQLAK